MTMPALRLLFMIRSNAIGRSGIDSSGQLRAPVHVTVHKDNSNLAVLKCQNKAHSKTPAPAVISRCCRFAACRGYEYLQDISTVEEVHHTMIDDGDGSRWATSVGLSLKLLDG